MAIAQRGSATTDDASAGDKTNYVVTKPTGVVAGDILVALWTANGVAVTPDTGFNLVVSQTNTITTKLYYKIAGGSEPSSYTFVSGLGPGVLSLVAFSGVDNINPISTNFATTGDAGGSDPATPTTNNDAQQGRVCYYRSAGVAAPTDITYTTAAAATELFDHVCHRASAATNRSHALYLDNSSFTGGGATKAGIAIVAAGTETSSTYGTFVLRENLVINAGTAAVTSTVNAPTLTRPTSAGTATVTGTANAPVAAQGRLPGQAAVTATVNAPTFTRPTPAGTATATGTANAPSTAATVNAGAAAASATAYGATVQFGILANAGHAAVAATAYQPTLILNDTIGDAGPVAATGTASTPSVAVAATAGQAGTTATAYGATVAIGAAAGQAAATGTAYAPSSARTANAGTAAATATANAPVPANGPLAGTVTISAVSFTPSTTHTAFAGTVTVSVTAYNADIATPIIASDSFHATENAIRGVVGILDATQFERLYTVEPDPEVTRDGDPDGRTCFSEADPEVSRPGDDDNRTFFVPYDEDEDVEDVTA